MNEPRDRRAPGGFLLHPVALAALALWIVNDHVLKSAYPGWITGKLSDIASLIAFPLLAVAATALWRARLGRAAPGRACLLAWTAATGLIMATINVFEGAAWLYCWGLGAAQWPLQALATIAHGNSLPGLQPVYLYMDPSDLLTLPALLVPLAIAWPWCSKPARDFLASFAMIPRDHALGDFF